MSPANELTWTDPTPVDFKGLSNITGVKVERVRLVTPSTEHMEITSDGWGAVVLMNYFSPGLRKFVAEMLPTLGQLRGIIIRYSDNEEATSPEYMSLNFTYGLLSYHPTFIDSWDSGEWRFAERSLDVDLNMSYEDLRELIYA